MNTVKLTAAGGVVFRPADDGGFEVAVGRAPSGMWRLPKGKREPGESIIETAAREVGEETGLRVDVGRIVGETGYSFTLPADPTRYEKTVTFYLMRATGGDTAARDGEFDVVEWLPPDEAIRRLTYANEAGILETAVALVAKQDIARA